MNTINRISLVLALALAATISSFIAVEVAAQNDEDADITEQTMQATIPGFGSPPPVIGKNLDGGNVYDNFMRIRSDGQFFLHLTMETDYEKPKSKPVMTAASFWCSNADFTDYENGGNNMPMGFTAKCLFAWQSDASKLGASGAQQTSPTKDYMDGFVVTYLLSSVFIPQANAFDMVMHKTSDNYLFRLWDDGRSVLPLVGFEVHDEGDPTPNSDTSSWVGIGKLKFISVEEAAELAGVDPSKFTPTNFPNQYEKVWKKEHDDMQQTMKEATASLTTESVADGSSSSGTTGDRRMLTASLATGIFSVALGAMGF